LWVAAGAGYAFLYVPLIIVVVYSFNNSRLNAEWVAEGRLPMPMRGLIP
jgi:spermidine/putrescine transport system permease protein